MRHERVKRRIVQAWLQYVEQQVCCRGPAYASEVSMHTMLPQGIDHSSTCSVQPEDLLCAH